MGGTIFEEVGYGKNVNEVFSELSSEAVRYSGEDPYNGTISTTSLGQEIVLDKYPALKKALKKKGALDLEEFDNILYPEKWVSRYIKEVSHVEAFAPKWVDQKQVVTRQKGAKMLQKFGIAAAENFYRDTMYNPEFNTLSEAKKAAKELALVKAQDVVVFQYRTTGDSSYRKQKVKLGFFNLQSDGKKYKSVRTSKTKVYLPIYKFTFFVFAAC